MFLSRLEESRLKRIDARKTHGTYCILFGETHNGKSVHSVTDRILTLFSQNETYCLLLKGNLQLHTEQRRSKATLWIHTVKPMGQGKIL